MKLLESVDLTGMTTATCISIWCDLLDTNFNNNDANKRFDLLISGSDDSEKLCAAAIREVLKALSRK